MEIKVGHIVTFNNDPEIKFTEGAVYNTTVDIYWFDKKECTVRMVKVPKEVLKLTNLQVVSKDK